MSTFFAEQATECSANLDMPKVRATPVLLELNVRGAAENILMSALIDWRHQLADPRVKLRVAFNACHAAIETLTGLDSPTPLSARFRFYDIAILAKLLGLEIPPTCLAILQKCRASANTDLRLDYALAETIAGSNNVLGQTIDEATFSKRQVLLKDTYAAYRELLGGDEGAIQR